MKARDPFFDNLKFILIVIVVFGHFCFEYRDNATMKALMNAIYTFHMPLFIFISGYFSKSIKQHRLEDITKVLIPFFVLEVFNLLYTKITHLGTGNSSFLYPTYQNWYLLSLFFWRLLIPYFSFISKTKGIVIAIVVSMIAGCIPQFGEFLSLYHTLYFLPIFVIGYYTDDIKSKVNNIKHYKWLAIVILLGFLSSIFYVSLNDASKSSDIANALIPINGYEGQISTMILRNISLITGICCSFLFLFLIPQRQTFYTSKGENTLYVYILHMFIVWGIVKLMGHTNIGLTLTVSVVASIAIAYVFSFNVIKTICQPIIELNYKKILKNKA